MPPNDKRKQIMLAAERLFAGRRIHEITLDDVVRTAKVGKGTVYRYFKNKDDLFFQTAAAGFDRLEELLTQNVPQEGSFEKQLLACCREISAFFNRRRELFRMMQTEAGRLRSRNGRFRKQWHAKRKKFNATLARVLAHGAAEGKIRSDVPADVLASVLLSMLRGLARDMPAMSKDLHGMRTIVDLFCNGAALARRTSRAHHKKAASIA